MMVTADLPIAGPGFDSQEADRAWRSGDTTAAIEAADRVLATGFDPGCLAAGVAAAATAADGALMDAADRWRGIAATLSGAPAALACGRAALAASLAGDVDAATSDLATAHELLPGAPPRGLTILLNGVAATVAAVRGEFDAAARRLAGLAVATVPADPFAAERWDDLAMTVMAAGGDDRTARVMFDGTPVTTRRRLLTAWLDLRAGRLTDARAGLVEVSAAPVLRRDAVLAAAIAVGLARRSGDDDALRATWHRVAPVVAGADVEPLLLDAWGELSVGAATPIDRDLIVAGMTAAVARAGNPAWGRETLAWWALQRAIGADDPAAAAVAATGLPEHTPGRVWAAVLAGDVDPAAVRAAAEALADRPWEAAVLCGAAAARHTDPSAVKDLLGAGRALRATFATADRATGGLSKRERSVGELLLDGLTHKEIGARLYISPKTVEQHVARIRQKLPAANRAELIAALRTALG